MADSPVHIGTTGEGDCLVRLTGRCTMQHSPATEALVAQMLGHDPNLHVAVDLAGCTYLDSTFLGCLFGLYRRFGVPTDAGPPRLRMYAPASKIKELFGPMRLDKVVRGQDGPAPAPLGATVPLGEAPVDRKELCRHVMECHRRLAETDGPARAAFTKIADAMERELQGA